MGGRQEAPRQFSQKRIGEAIEVVQGLAGRAKDSEMLNATGTVLAGLEEWRDELPADGIIARFDTLFRKSGKKELFEATHTLGTEASVASDTHWKIYHPKPDEYKGYQVKKEEGASLTLNDGNYIVFGDGKNKYTHIVFKVYNSSKKERRVMFNVCRERWSDFASGYLLKTIQQYIAEEETSKDVDARVIVFENGDGGKKRFFQCVAAQDSNVVDVTEVEPIIEEAA